MAKILPSTSHHSVFKAQLSIKKEGDSHFTHLGNAPSVEYEPSVETLEHYSSMSGVRTRDRVDILQVGATMNLELDEITAGNLALTLLGTASDFTQSAATANTMTIDVAPGAIIDTGYTNISNVDVGTLVEDVDFIVYEEAGVVMFTEAATASAGETLTFDVAEVDASANRQLVNALTATQPRVALLYIGFNTIGTRFKGLIPQVSLKPAGSFALVSDSDYATISIQGDVEASALYPNAPYGKFTELN